MSIGRETLHSSVGAICKVIGQLPCFHIFEKYIAQRFGDDTAELALRAFTHNAALDSSLISMRCFNEFLKPGGIKDDVRAHHFECLSVKPFLTDEEELAIHKYLAHLTVTRSDIVTKPWLLDGMVIRGLQQGIEFLTFVDSKLNLAEGLRLEVRGVAEAAGRIIPIIAKMAE